MSDGKSTTITPLLSLWTDKAVMVIPRPLADLKQTLPLASCWIKQRQAVKLPMSIKEKEQELVELPDLEKLRVYVEEEINR
jgi:carbon dioxide concentrating mechanism protein CcmO